MPISIPSRAFAIQTASIPASLMNCQILPLLIAKRISYTSVIRSMLLLHDRDSADVRAKLTGSKASVF